MSRSAEKSPSEIPQNAPKQGKDSNKQSAKYLEEDEYQIAPPSHPIYSGGWSTGTVLTTNPFSENTKYRTLDKGVA